MNGPVFKFRGCWFDVMNGLSNPHAFPLREFLLSLDDNSSCPEIVSKAAVDYCTDDGKWNGCDIVLSVILYFIAKTATTLPPGGDEQAANDLRRLLERGASRQEISQWAEGFYLPPTPPKRRPKFLVILGHGEAK